MALTPSEVQEALPDRYTLLREIGSGGMATVFLSVDRKYGRNVAIKVIDTAVSRSLAAERFLNEIDTVANLSHPHILPLHDSGEADGLLFYVMPFVRGESLRDRLEREGQLPVDEAIQVACEIADALAYAHGEGVIHRDIKPGNILLEAGHAVLADFGVAQAIAASEKEDSSLTATGVAVGTPAFMSPEQASGESDLDGRSDQYSLACVLFEMLSGAPVFQGSSGRGVITKHLKEKAPPVRLSRPTVPAGVDRAISRALEKAPADRFRSMTDFAQALKEGLTGGRGLWLRALLDRLIEHGYKTPVLLASVGLVAIVAWELLKGPFAPDPSWYETWPESLVVLPFEVPGSSDRERELSVEVAHQVAQELNWWDEIQALGSSSLTGILHDLGVDQLAVQSSGTAVRVARAAGTVAVLGVTARVRGDTATVDAALLDASNGEVVARRLSAQGDPDDLAALSGPIAAGLLQLDEDHPGPRGSGSTKLMAYRRFLMGQNALAQSQLSEAEEHFRTAIDLDETYATPLSWLALSLFLQAAEGVNSLPSVRQEITGSSMRAMARLTKVAGTDSLHISAFFAFQGGDYDQARRLYSEIVAQMPRDLFGWLMLGLIEEYDYWLAPGPDGVLVPRSNLQTALSAYRTTTELLPTFELGYSRFFQVSQLVGDAARARACPLFGQPRAELIPAGERPGLQGALTFCPLFRGTLEWVPRSVFDSADPSALLSGVNTLFQQAVRMVDAWEAFAPTEPRPRELKAEAYLALRSRMTVGPPDELRRLSREALANADAALSLRADTAPEDLFLIANLRLAGGLDSEAAEISGVAFGLYLGESDSVSSRPPAQAANVPLAIGQITKAFLISQTDDRSRFVRDPESGEMVAYAGAEPLVMGIKVLGAAGVTGPFLRQELERMDSVWQAVGYSDENKQLLRTSITPRIATALVQDTAAFSYWSRWVDISGILRERLDLVVAGQASAGAAFIDAVEAASGRVDHAERTFVLASLASQEGFSDVALRLFSRLDSIPHKVDVIDPGWGLMIISNYRRAVELKKLGRAAEADEQMARFMEAWSDPDSLALRILEEADLAKPRPPEGMER